MNSRNTSRILVTGADGFIGRAVTQRLKTRGFAVREVVRREAERAPDGDRRALGDICGPINWQENLREVTTVVHLANRAHVIRDRATNPLEEYRRVNVEATVAIAKAAVREGIGRFVYFSSIGVNGARTHGQPFSDQDIPAPTEPYAVSKWEAEQALREIEAGSSLQLTIIRPPLVYGPGVKGNFLRLIKLVRSGCPVPLGACENSRSYVGVSNLASLLERCISDARAAGRVVLAADGEDISTPQLLRVLAHALRCAPRIVGVPLWPLRTIAALAGVRPIFDRLTDSLQIDATRTRQLLDWEPEQTLAAGLAEMAHWYLREIGVG